MEWQMKPSIACDFDVFQGGSNTIGRTHVGSAVLFPYLSKPYQKEAHVLPASAAAPSAASCTAATAGASFDSASSGFIPAINFTANCGSKGEPIVADIKEPEKQQYFSERYVFCTAKSPTAPPSNPAAALTIVPNCSKRAFAQDKSIDLIDQISPLSKRSVTITSVRNDPSEYLKINKQHRTTVTAAAAITHRPALQRCQIDGCKEDLGKAKKEYHRRHKVCEMHSKAPRVMKSGLEQRFCQQCSRFHVVGEFDDAKRSCRRRLEGHNKRRRKSNCQDIASFSLASLDYDNLHLSHLMQRHQLAMPLSNMRFNYQNNDAQQLVEWPATDLHEQQKQVAMTTLQANYFNEINNRLRAILNEQINKGSSASSPSLLDLLQEQEQQQQQQQEQVSSCMQGKGLSLCTASANRPPTCALSLLSSSQAFPEPLITLHQQTRLDQKPPNYLSYLTNHPHQSFTMAGLSSANSNNAILTHPQSPFSLTNQPKRLALSMGMSAASSVLKEQLIYQKHVPPIPNPHNMSLIQSLAPHNPILARPMHEAAASHHQPEQLGMAMEFNS